MSENLRRETQTEPQTPILKIGVFVGIGFISGLLSGYRSASDNECQQEAVAIIQSEAKE